MQLQGISTHSHFNKEVSAEIDSGMEPLMLVACKALYVSPGIQSQPTAQNPLPVSKP